MRRAAGRTIWSSSTTIPPTPLTQDNFPGHFCYAFDARNVESVISQGRLIVDHGRLASMDEADILAYANEQARRLWALL